MNAYFIKENDFNDFLSKMIGSKTVIGPTAKSIKEHTRYVFAKLESPEQLRLDYDVTILPPKKEFFPTCQTLVTFDGNKFKGNVNPEEKILFGVHFYDVKALDATDHLFNENNTDVNYMAHREKATVVASNIQAISPRGFWGSVGTDVKPKGHDAFLTKVNGGYVFETLTKKGDALTKMGKFGKASSDQVNEAQKVNDDVMSKCSQKLDHDTNTIAKKVRDQFSNKELWANLSEDCFSCGSCNTTCPTCYCFDVQDKWNLDQKTGSRMRYWDACLTEEFSKVSLGAGATENFREERGERFRHRVMRKAAYLNEKLGGPACVGCGRCSTACTADIADPVNVIKKIMEV